MARLSRRNLLGVGSCTVAVGIAAAAIARPDAQAVEVVPAAHDPDGPMLALCARFMALQALLDASYGREESLYRLLKRQGASNEPLRALEERQEIDRKPLNNEQKELLESISDLAASTLAGQGARARVLMAWYGIDKHSQGHEALEWCNLAPLFRDLLGEEV